MARSIYGASGAAQVVSPTGVPQTASATVKTARTGGSTVTDTQNMLNQGTGGVVVPDARGQIIFQGPDNSTATYWLDFNDGGPRWAVNPVDLSAMFSAAAAARDLAAFTTPGGTTPKSSLPYTPNALSQALATALDGLVIPRANSVSARDTRFPTPADGDRVYRTDLHAHQTYRAFATPRWVTDMALIAEFNLSVDTPSVQFASIPQEWKSLRLVYRARAVGSLSNSVKTNEVSLRFNADSGANYSAAGRISRVKQVSGIYTYEVDGAGAGGGTSSTAVTAMLNNVAGMGSTTCHVGVCPGSDLGTVFGGGEISITGYANPATRKPIQGISGFGDGNGGSGTAYMSQAYLQGGWSSNSAITQIDVFATGATAWAASSSFALYGLS